MYRSIEIKGFRQFDHLELPNLGRVNLLVGRNNAGKTSILEAIEMLALGGRITSLLRSLRRRGEFSSDPSGERPSQFELDIRHLFHRHSLELGAAFAIESITETNRVTVRCEIQNVPLEQLGQTSLLDDSELDSQLALHIIGADNPDGSIMPLTPIGTMVSDPFRRAALGGGRVGSPVVFLGTEGADANTLHQVWDALVLTEEEEKVTAAMRLIEPTIERFAFAGLGARAASVAFVKLKGADQRVPLGSLGDGTRRLLALAVYLTRASGGVLLVDEIDTGLHYTALESMWRFVVDTARRFDIQIFATSHSGDCIRALAWLQSDDPELAAEVSVHRVEKGQSRTVAYSAAEIETAARHHVEVRG
jgi:predicted ATPase